MNKKYFCLFEDGVMVQNECYHETLEEAQEFLYDFFRCKFTMADFENLIQIGKFEMYKKLDGVRHRILIKVVDIQNNKDLREELL